jgi:hypothetical protein
MLLKAKRCFHIGVFDRIRLKGNVSENGQPAYNQREDRRVYYINSRQTGSEMGGFLFSFFHEFRQNLLYVQSAVKVPLYCWRMRPGVGDIFKLNSSSARLSPGSERICRRSVRKGANCCLKAPSI